jgi:maltose alpha-D-glucosyltransferase/alpha-amylase
MSDQLWFKDAVIYQVHVKTFYDSNGDGVGDFRGMIEKIDYFAELGVTAIWLLPFYPSPLRDDGYDISDYFSVNPLYGTLEDFQELLSEAHKRGLRVITELVINHTSDQNAWFQTARRAPVGSVERDFYVWSDSPTKYKEARIIFKDFEPSNWSWDPVAKAYFWHRFFHHQPDLNFESPAVHDAVFRALDFWLEMGVDGLRLDAVPYLYEREGTNCENLPETHAMLKKLRAHIDQKFTGRMLLAEANQWPEDAAAYFGDGDECHMNFHFPIMPRLFMSLQMEDRFPIIDILNQTPPIPPACQWATFLRNHDELTLEMVTDEERDYMYRVYADDPRARINLGIRRRLAPLLGNNRRRIELINALLFSLPGTPIVYYGDEIGMGDNFYLGDRNGVRTPMQWAPDRNGGFSRANPQQLYLPAVIDPEYHYEAVNVENQQRNLSSLFWWMRRLIVERRRWHAFGAGTIRFLHPENAKLLAFIRETEEEAILVVANLSRFTQASELDLTEYAGTRPMEIFSRQKMPELHAGGTMFMLGPHDFYWIALRRKGARPPGETVTVPSRPEALEWGGPIAPRVRELLERELLPGYLQGCRWFAARGQTLRDLRITDEFALQPEPNPSRMLVVSATFSEGMGESYLLPLHLSTGEQATRILADAPRLVIARFREGADEQVLHDAMLDAGFRGSLLELFGSARARGSRLSARTGSAFDPDPVKEVSARSQVVNLEGSNSTIAFGDRYFLKLFRRLEWGKQPEEELTRHLHEAKFPHTAPYAGTLEYGNGSSSSRPIVMALLLGFVQNQGDAGSYTVDAVGRYFERVLAERPELTDSVALTDAIGGVYPERARQLAQRVAELHLTLAKDPDHQAFAPEPFTSLYQRSLYQAVRGALLRTNRLITSHRPQLPPEIAEMAGRVLQSEQAILTRYERLVHSKVNAQKTVVHGSLHLGQVLNTGKDFVIVDLEGDPTRPLSERSLKRSPLVDVASMMRSFDFAAHVALRRQQPDDQNLLAPWGDAWVREISVIFLAAYIEAAKPGGFLPQTDEELRLLLEVFVLDRAVAEIANEIVYRPEMAIVPLRAIIELLSPYTTVP